MSRVIDAEAAFLDLLAGEQPLEAFADPVARAAAAGTDADELSGIRDLSRIALTVRTTIAELRRRERELLALYETAGDLSSLHGVEEVLQAIVRRARQLLATDMAYISLIDEEHRCVYQRVTDGVLTGDFKQLQLKLGAGLGGLVAQSGDAIISRNYLLDPRIVHDSDLRRKVNEEGLVAVLGVPLRLGDRVLGVLYAADRKERSFSADDAALLASLAAHATIALENARLLEEARSALDRSDLLAAELQDRSQRIEWLTTVDEALLNVLLNEGTLVDLVQELNRLLGEPVVLLDEDRRIAASAPDPTTIGSEEELAAMLDAPPPRGSLHVLSGGTAIYTPMIVGSQSLGAIIARVDPRTAETAAAALERAALVSAVALLQRRSLAEAEQRVRRELVTDLIREEENPDALRQRARVLGVDLDRQWCVVVAATGSSDGLRRGARTLARRLGGLTGEHRGRFVFVLPDIEPAEAARVVREQLYDSDARVTTAASDLAVGPDAVAAAFRSAERTLSAAFALGRVGQAVTTSDLGVFGLVLAGNDPSAVAEFLERTIGPLVRYDERRSTELVRTAEAYFAHAGHITNSAKALHVHPNTLYLRLERIDQLLGEEWRGPEQSLQLNLAARMRHLSPILGSHAEAK